MLTSAERQDMLAKFRRPPADLEAAAKGLNERQSDTPYGEGGWTVARISRSRSPGCAPGKAGRGVAGGMTGLIGVAGDPGSHSSPE